jgi:transposase
VPAFQHDFGCHDVLIGGAPCALKKARPDPAGECVDSWQAEPSLGQFTHKDYDMAKRKKSTFERLTLDAMNRKQRRQLGQKLAASDPSLTIVHPNAGGIDVGNQSHFAAVPADRDPQPVQEFGCWTADLIRLAEWLRSCRIDTVALQATGVYWIPLYDILSKHGVRVVLVNAQHTKNVPGRKSDVQECQWLMKLHTYGLLRDSFRLPETMERVRTIWRLRGRHVEAAGQAVQHMQKALTKMNLQLSNVLSDISGVSGRAIIAAILRGERDPYILAHLCDYRVQASREEVARSLEGNWREDVLFELQQAIDGYDFAQLQIQECDKKLEAYLASLPTRTLNGRETAQGSAATTVAKSPKVKTSRKPKGNAPALDLEAELQRICGVNLTTIDGIDVMTAQTIVSEIGTDMSAFPSEEEFACWLGLSPSPPVSGGKVIGRGQRKVKNRVAQALRMSATTLLNSKSYLGARYRHLLRQLPAKRSAVKAMAHYLALLVYRMFTRGEAWVDRGAERFEQKQAQRELANLKSRALARGFQLVPIALANF